MADAATTVSAGGAAPRATTTAVVTGAAVTNTTISAAATSGYGLVMYNWNPASQLSDYLAAEAQVMAGTPGARAKIIAIGDSTTSGVGGAPTNYRATAAYPAQLAVTLTKDDVPANADDFLGGGAFEDGRLTLLGTAVWSGAQDAGGQLIQTAQAGDGVAFSLTAPGTYDSLDIDYIDSYGGQLLVTAEPANGGPAITGTIDIGNSGITRTQTLQLATQPKAFSSVRITAVGSQAVFIEGAAFWNSRDPSAEIYNAGKGGADSAVVGTGSTGGYGEIPGAYEVGANLVLIDYGINDILNQTETTAQTVANIALMVQVFRSEGCDPIIVIPEPFTNANYATALPALRAGLQALSLAQNVPLIDLSATYGNDAAALAAAGLLADNVHPDAKLYADIGSQIAALLAKGTAPAIAPVVTPVATSLSAATLATVSSADPLTVSLMSDSAFPTGSALTLAGNALRYTPGPVTAASLNTVSYAVTDIVTGATTQETQNVTLLPACFASGTRIATPRGAVAVEALAIGELVLTARGGPRPIRWIGRRHVDFARDPQLPRPVRIRSGAFASGVPTRDLVLSPEHAVYVETVHALTPIAGLINGATIASDAAMAEVTYYHVELDRHDVVLAEGVAAESWLDTGNRAAFANAPTAGYPDIGADAATGAPQPADLYATQGYAPLLDGGPALDATRAALARRAMALGWPAGQEARLEVTRLGPVAARFDAATRFVRLVSPAGFTRPDRRQLGALISDMVIDGVAVAQPDRRLHRGFHELEQHGPHRVCWTDGEAVIDFGPSDIGPAAPSRKLAFIVRGLARNGLAT